MQITIVSDKQSRNVDGHLLLNTDEDDAYDKLDEDYYRSICEVIELRLQRRKLYGNGWVSSGLEGNFWQMHDDIGRIKSMISRNKEGNVNEKLEDKLKDVINRSLFILAILKERKDIEYIEKAKQLKGEKDDKQQK